MGKQIRVDEVVSRKSDFKRVTIGKIDNCGGSPTFWDKNENSGYSENSLSRLDYTKSLVKARDLISKNKFFINVLPDKSEESNGVMSALTDAIRWDIGKKLDEWIENSVSD